MWHEIQNNKHFHKKAPRTIQNEETFSNTENPLSDGQIQIDTQNKHIHCITTRNKLKNIYANRYLNDNTNSNMLNTSRTYNVSTAPFKPENRTPTQSLWQYRNKLILNIRDILIYNAQKSNTKKGAKSSMFSTPN